MRGRDTEREQRGGEKMVAYKRKVYINIGKSSIVFLTKQGEKVRCR